MADETGSIKSQGLGFFTSGGVLKTREQLKTEETRSDAQASSSDGVHASFSEQISEALGKVEGRFVERANTSISQVQSAQADIREARDLISRELAAAKSLKEALSNADDDNAQKYRATLDDLQRERSELADRIDLHNREGSGNRRQILSLGGRDEGSAVEVKAVVFKGGKGAEAPSLNDVKSVDDFIDSLRSERTSLKAQAGALRETKASIKEAVKAAKDALSEIRKDALSTFDQAQSLSEKVSQAVRSGGIELVEQTIKDTLSASSVADLI